jgi:hypothetical protein
MIVLFILIDDPTASSRRLTKWSVCWQIIHMKQKQDPIAFVQTVIHELAQIRSTMELLSHFIICEMADRKGVKQEELTAFFKSQAGAKARKFYARYVKELHLHKDE